MNMKNPRVLITALCLFTLFATCGSAPEPETAQVVEAPRPVEIPTPEEQLKPPETVKDPRFDGDGGKGITLAVLQPAATGLQREEQYLTSFVQGILTSDLNRVTAMTIIDRQNLDRVIAEQVAAAGVTKDTADKKIGETTGADFVLTGELIRIRTGGYSLQLAVTELSTNERKASHTAAASVAGIERSTAVKDAAADILSQMGINLTEEGKKLLYGMEEKTVAAETALAKGLTAQRAASTPQTTIETMSYLYQAQALDPSLLETAGRLAAYQAAVFTAPEVTIPELAVPVYTGNIGADARNKIAAYRAQGEAIRKQQAYLLDQKKVLMDQQKTLLAKQRELIALLHETENFYEAHPPFEIIYDPALEQVGEVDFQKETVNLRFRIATTGTASLQVMRNIIDGLESMRQGFRSINEGLDKIQPQLDTVNAAGREYAVSPVSAGIQARDKTMGDSWGFDKWEQGKGRTFAIQAALYNDRGKRIASASVSLKNEIMGTSYTAPQNAIGFCTFQDVKVNDISDTLKITINRVNTVAVDNAANVGYIKISTGYTEDGYDIYGYNRTGYDRDG
jgi:TolB-like protein